MIAIGLACALLIGLTLGMLGGGGSILTVPVFVYVLGYNPKLAIAMSLPVVGATSFIGALRHWRAGNLHFQSALLLGIAAMVGAFAGARASVWLSGRSQLLLLGVLMLASSVMMFKDSVRATPILDTGAGTAPLSLLLVVGFAVGTLTGIVGIGGGFLIVPALVLLARVPMHQAVGTSLAVITLNSIAGFAGQRIIGEIPLGVVLSFTGVAIVGILIGTVLIRHVQARALKRAFSVLLMVIAALVLWQNHARL
jgi:uncharacterized membrane protein YfcA